MEKDSHFIFQEIEKKANDLVERLNNLNKNITEIYNEIHNDNVNDYERLLKYLNNLNG